MTTPSKPRTRRGLLLTLAVVLFLPLAASAQDRPDRTERLKQALGLTDAQAALVDEAVGDEADPGDLWTVAAALTPTLTDEQKEKLFSRPDRPERPDRQRKVRDRRGERPDRPARQRPADSTRAERREEAREARKADMQAALGLTDAQVQQFEALHAERRARFEELREDRERLREEMRERRAERPEPGELPEEVAAILTPEQQEIARVHRALAAHVAHRHHGHSRHSVRR